MGIYKVFDDGKVRDLARQCEGKVRYDKKSAITKAKEAHRSGRVREARVYPCGDHWHIAKNRTMNKKFID